MPHIASDRVGPIARISWPAWLVGLSLLVVLLGPEERAGRVPGGEADGSRTILVSGVKQPRWLDVGEDATVFIAARRLTRGTDPEPDDESAEPEVILALTSTGALTIFADGF